MQFSNQKANNMTDNTGPDMENLIRYLKVTLALVICALAVTITGIMKIIL